MQRVAGMRGWLAAFRAYMFLRHDGGIAVCNAVVAAADHAKVRASPPTWGGDAPARLRVHRRALACMTRLVTLQSHRDAEAWQAQSLSCVVFPLSSRLARVSCSFFWCLLRVSCCVVVTNPKYMLAHSRARRARSTEYMFRAKCWEIRTSRVVCSKPSLSLSLSFRAPAQQANGADACEWRFRLRVGRGSRFRSPGLVLRQARPGPPESLENIFLAEVRAGSARLLPVDLSGTRPVRGASTPSCMGTRLLRPVPALFHVLTEMSLSGKHSWRPPRTSSSVDDEKQARSFDSRS